MFQIGAFEAKNTLGSLLDRVEDGQEILITRHGKPVARLTSATGAPIVTEEQREKARAALARMSEQAKEMNATPFNWPEWKSYRDEGRR